jgi:hypothetical protein
MMSDPVAQVVESVSDWPNCNADKMITLLKATKPEDYGGNIKPFYSNYPLYSAMSTDQKMKTLKYFSKFTAEKKAAIIIICQHVSLTAATVGKTRAEAVHKDDLVRLLELRKDPTSQMAWTNAEKTLKRDELDSRNSIDIPAISGTGSAADAFDPYSVLAERYMDYNTFCPQNGLIQYHFENGESVPMIPLRTTRPEYTSLSAQCNELNPCNKSRNKIMRDGPWIKDNWLKLRSYMSLVLSDFNRSGKNTGNHFIYYISSFIKNIGC